MPVIALPPGITITVNGVDNPNPSTISTTSPVLFTAQTWVQNPTNFSSGYPYSWTFGDSSTSNVQSPPSHVFSPGTYTVTVSATNGASNSVVIIIAGPPAPPPSDSSDNVTPVELPLLRSVDTHSFDAVDISRQMKYEAGAGRSRQAFTVVPEILNGAWDMNQAQLDIFVNWYEGLFAGAREFDIQVVDQGTNIGTIWSKAKFIVPPETESVNGGTYVVRCQLLLLGKRFTIRSAPSLKGSATIAVNGKGSLDPVSTLFGAAAISINGKSKITS